MKKLELTLHGQEEKREIWHVVMDGGPEEIETLREMFPKNSPEVKILERGLPRSLMGELVPNALSFPCYVFIRPDTGAVRKVLF